MPSGYRTNKQPLFNNLFISRKPFRFMLWALRFSSSVWEEEVGVETSTRA